MYQSPKSDTEASAEQSIEKRIDDRAQQYEEVGGGQDRRRDQVGLAGDCSFHSLNKGHNYIRGPAYEEGGDDEEETHNAAMVVLGLLTVLQGGQ